MHDENSYLTLTYNDENLPKNKSLKIDHLQKFFRKLRRKTGKEIRYYAVGEYGDKLSRPHYHVCLFGYDFSDKELLTTKRWKKARFQTGSLFALYWSKYLETIWQRGFNTIGELTFESASYVARYVLKKQTGKNSKKYYKSKKPEFSIMSRKPGIGRSWFDKYMTDVYPKDFFHVRGRRSRPPRYYDNVLQNVKPFLYDEIKERREINAGPRDSAERRRAIEKYKELIQREIDSGRSYEKN